MATLILFPVDLLFFLPIPTSFSPADLENETRQDKDYFLPKTIPLSSFFFFQAGT